MDDGAGGRAGGLARVNIGEPVLQHLDGFVGGGDRVAAATPVKQHRVPAVGMARAKSHRHTERRWLENGVQPRSVKASANEGNGRKRVEIPEHARAIHQDNVGARRGM